MRFYCHSSFCLKAEKRPLNSFRPVEKFLENPGGRCPDCGSYLVKSVTAKEKYSKNRTAESAHKSHKGNKFY